MGTRVAVGHAGEGSGEAQGARAVAEAVAGLGGLAPTFGFAFATSHIDLAAVARGIKRALPEVPVIGCTTGGEFVGDRISSGGTSVCLVASDEISVSCALASGLRRNTRRAARQLVRSLQLGRGGARFATPHRTILLLTDGMAGNGETLVDTLAMESGAEVAIAGGAAGDDAAFVESFVFLDGQVHTDAVVALELSSVKPIGVGVHHGWCAASEPGLVTGSSGTAVTEIDGRPAIEFYRAYARALGVELTPENQNEFVFTHELGIVLMRDELKVRAPLGVNPDGSISCASEIPAGQRVRIVRGDEDAIVNAARTAAQAAIADLAGHGCAGAIVFDCVARKLVLKDAFAREVAAIGEAVQAPLAGFNTYGEIARVQGQLSGFHNTTAVVVALPA
ncbi:MAG: FIST N-terminal domain-containing protein [Planctomycetota bacterium]